MPKKKKELTEARFFYEFPIDAPEHTPDNVGIMFGSKSAFNPDFSPDAWARDEMGQLFQDAMAHCYSMALDDMSKNKGEHTDFSRRMTARANYWIKLAEKCRYTRKEPIA